MGRQKVAKKPEEVREPPAGPPREPKPGDMLTIAEVAPLLSMSEETVRHIIRKGKLPAIRPSERVIRIQRADLEAFIDASRTNKATTN